MTPEKTAALLDISIDRFAKDAQRRELGVRPINTAGEGQLSLFDQSEDGVTLVSFDGKTL